MSKSIRILALDISTNPGFAVIDVKQRKNGVKLSLVHACSLKTDTGNTDAQRYAYIGAQTTLLLHDYAPFDAVVREHFTKGRNKRATQTIFGAWASMDLALAQYGYTVGAEIPPSEVKKAAKGKGTATKEEVDEGVRKWLGLSDEFTFKSDDESDACAIAIAYLLREGIITKEDD